MMKYKRIQSKRTRIQNREELLTQLNEHNDPRPIEHLDRTESYFEHYCDFCECLKKNLSLFDSGKKELTLLKKEVWFIADIL